jgi:CRP/FNR family transcriptional regulator, cyclic AMP receptor protein
LNREKTKEILLRHGWFAGLPPPLADLILDKSTQRDVVADALIYATGDEPTGQFAVLSGEVRLVANTTAGKHILYRILKPSGWFGHLSVLDHRPRFQDAVAVGPTRLLHLSMAGFNAIIEREPGHILHFAHLICRDIREAMGMLAEMRATPLPRRLAQVLMQTASGEASSERMTQEALAAMVGASRQTVNRVLRRWQEGRLIRIEYGRVFVRNASKLAAVAGPRVADASRG